MQAQSDDDDVGPDDVNVAVEGGFMDEFFSEVRLLRNVLHSFPKGFFCNIEGKRPDRSPVFSVFLISAAFLYSTLAQSLYVHDKL